MKKSEKQEAAVVVEPDFSGLTPEQYAALSELELADRARGEGPEAVYAWAELEFGVKPAPFHREWVEEIFANKRVAICAPPESAKTTWGIIFVTWWIGKHPWQTNGVCSAGDSAALKIGQKIADVIEKSRMWAMVFPGVKPDQGHWSREGWEVVDTLMAPELWRKRTATKKDPTLLAGGVGSSIWNGKRISGILEFDDIHDEESRTSVLVCNKIVDFVKFTGLPRVKKNARALAFQTRWNPKDVIAYFKTLAAFKVFLHKAILDDGTSYWEEQWPLERLEAMRADIGETAFDLVYQGNDRALEGHVLKTEWLHDFPAIQIENRWNRYFGVDFARRLRDMPRRGDPDRFAIGVVVDTGARLVVEDVFAEVLYLSDAEALFFTKAAIYKPKVSGVEVNGLGQEFYLALLRRMRAGGRGWVVRPLTTTRDKLSRLTEMAPYFTSGQVLVSDLVTPGLGLFRGEWASFPRGHDDTLDAVYFAWLCSGHLLPAESFEQRNERLRLPAPVPIAKVIENAYFA